MSSRSFNAKAWRLARARAEQEAASGSGAVAEHVRPPMSPPEAKRVKVVQGLAAEAEIALPSAEEKGKSVAAEEPVVSQTPARDVVDLTDGDTSGGEGAGEKAGVEASPGTESEGGRKAIVAEVRPPRARGRPGFVCASPALRLEHVTVTDPGAASLWREDFGREVTGLGPSPSEFDRSLMQKVSTVELVRSTAVMLARSLGSMHVLEEYASERDRVLSSHLQMKKELDELRAETGRKEKALSDLRGELVKMKSLEEKVQKTSEELAVVRAGRDALTSLWQQQSAELGHSQARCEQLKATVAEAEKGVTGLSVGLVNLQIEAAVSGEEKDAEILRLRAASAELQKANADLLDQGLAAFSAGFDRARSQAVLFAPTLPLEQFDETKVVIAGELVEEPDE